MIRLSLVLTIAACGSTVAAAQWLNYPAPGIPRLRDGKPNLSAYSPGSGWQAGSVWTLDGRQAADAGKL